MWFVSLLRKNIMLNVLGGITLTAVFTFVLVYSLIA